MKALKAIIAAGALLCIPAAAQATVVTGISIGLGSAPVTVATDSGSGYASYACTTTCASGYSLISVNGTGSPLVAQPQLLTNNLDIKTSASGDLYVWISQQGLTAPTGVSNFLSAFTTNALSGVTSIVENTFISTANTIYAGTLLATQTFTAANSANSIVSASPNITGPFSETVEYIIHFSGTGQANSSANISVVPEPASIALLGGGLLGLAGFAGMRRRKSKVA